MQILLGEYNESNELLCTDISKAFSSTLLPHVAHKVEDRLTAQHPVAHVSTQHDGRLILQDGGGVAWPDGQPRTDRCNFSFKP